MIELLKLCVIVTACGAVWCGFCGLCLRYFDGKERVPR